MRDACGDAPIGIQRIALTADAQKIDRRMLGTAGVVKLWPAGKQLVVGEGLETVLAAATRLPYRDEPLRPAWAALSDGMLKKFPIIDGVERLILLADNDVNNAGAIAAEACKRRWLEAGRRVALLMPDRPGHRFQRRRSRQSGAGTMNGFTAKEFEPDPAAGAKTTRRTVAQRPAPDITVAASPRNTPRSARRCSGRCTGAARRCAASTMRRGGRTSGIIRTGSGRCCWSRPSGSNTRSR